MRYRSRPRTSRRSEARALGLLVVLAIPAIGCSSVLGPQQDELSEARARWRANAPLNYVFDFQRSCFCGPPTIRAVRILVQSGEVESANFIDTGEPVEPLSAVPTIEDLFDEIQDAIDREAFRLEATYDPQYGFPKSVSIDFIEMAVDEEQAFEVMNFQEPLF